MSIRLIISFFFGVVSFILTLLVTISVPIAKSIYLLHINSNGGGGTAVTARIGVFGACVYGNTRRVGAQDHLIGLASTGEGSCTHAAVGYTLDPTIFGVDVPSHASSIVVEGLTKALVLNAIACGVAGLGLLLGMAVLCCNGKHAESTLHHALGISASIAAVSFWMDLIVVLLARQRVENYTDGAASGHMGHALWLAFGAMNTGSVILMQHALNHTPTAVDHPELILWESWHWGKGRVPFPSMTTSEKSNTPRRKITAEDMGEARLGEGATNAAASRHSV